MRDDAFHERPVQAHESCDRREVRSLPVATTAQFAAPDGALLDLPGAHERGDSCALRSHPGSRE
eukprot:3062148-Pyramimonas_sp.AAC.1